MNMVLMVEDINMLIKTIIYDKITKTIFTKLIDRERINYIIKACNKTVQA